MPEQTDPASKPTEEIEITPEMLQAGTEVVRTMVLDEAVGPLFDGAGLASEVYRAMEIRRRVSESSTQDVRRPAAWLKGGAKLTALFPGETVMPQHPAPSDQIQPGAPPPSAEARANTICDMAEEIAMLKMARDCRESYFRRLVEAIDYRDRRIAELKSELATRPAAFMDPAPDPEPAFMKALRAGNKAPGGLIR